MNKFVLAVIDGTKARFFTLESVALPEYESGPNLIEREGLSNQSKELSGKELWANTKTGRNRGSGGQGHGYDDHRANHLGEFERNFAKETVHELLQLIQKYEAQELVLVAEPQILGMIRDVLNNLLPKNIQLHELAKDLCKLKPLEIHEYLATKNLLPPRKVVVNQ